MSQTYDLFVGSLPTGFGKAQVEELFDKFGPIKSIKVLDNGVGPCSAIAFVHYGMEEHALSAIEEMSTYMIHGISLKVRKSDKWLKRIGEYNSTSSKKTSFKGNPQSKPVDKSAKPSAANYGMWQPPSIEPKYQSKGDLSSVAVVASNNALQVSYPSKSLGSLTKESVAVTHVENALIFYAYFTNRNLDLQELTAELQKVCPQMLTICTAPCVTKVYGSLYSIDKNWYRCEVLDTDNHLDRSLIRYIDFGNTEMVSNSKLVELPETLQRKIPLAVKFVLHDLHLSPSYQDNPDEAFNYVKDNLTDQLLSLELKPSANGSHMEVWKLFINGTDFIDHVVSKGYLVRAYDTSRILGIDGNKHSSSSKNTQLALMVNGKHGRGQETNALTPVYTTQLSQENKMLQMENQRLKNELERTTGRNKALQDEFLHQQKTNIFTELPQIMCDLDQVRLLRQQLPIRPDTVDYIQVSVELLKQEQSETALTPFDKLLREKTRCQVEQYNNAQENILNCKDKELLNALISERDDIRKRTHKELTFFCKSIHSNTLTDKVRAFETALAELKRVYQRFLTMNTYSCETNLPLEELHQFYMSTKEEKLSEFLDIQIQTDLAHKSFVEEIQPAYQSLEQTKVKSFSLPEAMEALENLKSCLGKEIKSCSLEETKADSIVGMITKILCQKLEHELEGVRDLDSLEHEYSSLLEKMSLGLNGPAPDMKNLMANRKESKKLRSKLRHALADKKDLEEECDDCTDEQVAEVNRKLDDLRLGLHDTFLEEDRIISYAASLQDSVYPELNIIFPELGLQTYSKYNGLVKGSLELEHFNLEPVPSIFPSEVHYTSTFCSRPIRLKEYHVLGDDNEKDLFIQRVQQYSELSHECLLSVDAVFFGEKGRSIYVQQPFLPSLHSYYKESNVMTPNEIRIILLDILAALDSLHSRGIAYGKLHPETVFLSQEFHAVLDTVDFAPGKSNFSLPAVNGLRFQLPCNNGKSKTTLEDIYSFSCLMLWLLSPTTKFNVDASGSTDLTSLKLRAPAAQLLAAVRSVLEKPISQYPLVVDLLKHPSLNQRIPSPSLDTEDSCLDCVPSLMPTKSYCSDPEDEASNGEMEQICRLSDEQESGADDQSEVVESLTLAEEEEEAAEEEEEEAAAANFNGLEKADKQSVLSNISNNSRDEECDINLTYESLRQSQCTLTSSNAMDDVE